MGWKEFLKVYVPTLIAAVFVSAFVSNSGGWTQMTGGHTGVKGMVSIFGFLGGIAIGLIVLSFGIGAVVWLVIYPLKSQRPRYLRFVKNTLFVFAAVLIVGSLYGVAQKEGNGSVRKPEAASAPESPGSSEAAGRRGRIVRDEDGDPIRIKVPEQENTAETWNETALWEMAVQQEVVKWISRGETVTVIEEEGSHYKVEHEGDVGYVRKENLKTEK